MTCKHFRFQVPREDADELREADKEPCAVCDHKELYDFLRHTIMNFDHEFRYQQHPQACQAAPV